MNELVSLQFVEECLTFKGSKYETKTIKSGYKVYMKLRIRNVQPEDFMEYRCVAKNSLGGSDGTITLYGRWNILKTIF